MAQPAAGRLQNNKESIIMADHNKIEQNEITSSDNQKDTRKPGEGEELSQSEQDKVSGGLLPAV